MLAPTGYSANDNDACKFEVSLSTYRRQMVDTLISQYQAPTALRVYGEELYGVDK